MHLPDDDRVRPKDGIGSESRGPLSLMSRVESQVKLFLLPSLVRIQRDGRQCIIQSYGEAAKPPIDVLAD